MNKYLPLIKLVMLSSSSLNKKHGDKMRELCASVLSQVIIQSLLMIFIFHFGVVGGTLGAAGGAIFGFKNKTNILKYFIAGAVSGAVLSYRITIATFDYFLQCDHEDERGFFLRLIDIVAGESNILQDQDHIFLITEVASCEKVNYEKVIKVPKIEISNYNVCDASGNTTCCSICLQDFEVGDAAGVFPKCEHKCHPQCISQWLASHNSCPVCRRTI